MKNEIETVILVQETAREIYRIRVQEGCPGSPYCCVELYVKHMGHGAIAANNQVEWNLHLSKSEVKALRKALKRWAR